MRKSMRERAEDDRASAPAISFVWGNASEVIQKQAFIFPAKRLSRRPRNQQAMNYGDLQQQLLISVLCV